MMGQHDRSEALFYCAPSRILSYIRIPFSAVARFMGVIVTS
jgi:hypothetical protein